MPWALEQACREERASDELPGLTFRTGPVGREPYLPHLSRAQVLAARLFAKVYPNLLTTSGRK